MKIAIRPLSTTILIILVGTFCTAQEVTWADDVACIVYNNCVKCHRPEGVAPFSLLSYNEAFIWRNFIRTAVLDNEMPPWPARGGSMEYVDDDRLTDAELNAIVNWVDQGAPSGNLENAPDIPNLPTGEEISNPDLVVQIEPYTSHAADEDDYKCFVIPTNLGENMYVTGFEVVPGNKGIVHHVILFEDASSDIMDLDEADPGPGYTCFGGTGSFSSSVVSGWVPGQTSSTFPDGMGVLLPAGTNLIIQTHYPEDTEGEMDSTKVNLTLGTALDVPRQMFFSPLLNHTGFSLIDGPLMIPADSVRTYRAQFTTFFKSTVFSVLPHMHLIGTKMKAYGITPAGDTLHFFDIPKWDFEWQLSYSFRKPIILPFGTRLVAEATYDNTANNPFQPSDPPEDVVQGEATTDEMLLVFFALAQYQNGDEDLEFTDKPPLSEECLGPSATRTLLPESAFRIYPNPASETLYIYSNQTQQYDATLKTINGSALFTRRNAERIDVSTMMPGIYILELQTDSGVLAKKVVLD